MPLRSCIEAVDAGGDTPAGFPRCRSGRSVEMGKAVGP